MQSHLGVCASERRGLTTGAVDLGDSSPSPCRANLHPPQTTNPSPLGRPARKEVMNTREFVAKGITKVFEDLAVALADEYAKEYGEDMPTGALAFEVMKAEMYMLKQWANFADRESAQQKGNHANSR